MSSSEDEYGLYEEQDDAGELVLFRQQPGDFVRGERGGVSFWCWLVMVSNSMERAAYYGLLSTMMSYMTIELELNGVVSVVILRVFLMIGYTCILFTGIMGDTIIGRFKTCISTTLWGLVGYILLVIFSITSGVETVELAIFLISAFVFIAPGQSGYQANIPVLMAEQIPSGYSVTAKPGIYKDSRLTVQSSFRKYYTVKNLGALLGILVVPTVNKTVNFGTGYFVNLTLVLCSIVVLVAGYPGYRLKKIHPGALSELRNNIVLYFKGSISLSGKPDIDKIEKEFKDEGKLEEAKRSIQLILIILWYPLYWGLYQLVFDSFTIQGYQMRRPSWITPEQLSFVNPLIIIIVTPLLDIFFFPALQKRKNFGQIARISTGFFFMALSLISASIIQLFIYNSGPWYSFTSPDTPSGAVNDVSLFWQIIPFAFCGLSEVFAVITGFELTFSLAPSGLKATFSGAFQATNSIGSILGMVLGLWSGNPSLLYQFIFAAVAMTVLSALFTIHYHKLDKQLGKMDIYDDL